MSSQSGFLLLVATALLVGCTGAKNVDLKHERANLRATYATALAAAQSEPPANVDKFLTFYDDDVRLYPPGAPLLLGKEAVRKLLAGTTFTNMRSTVLNVEVAAAGDLGYTTGTYEVIGSDHTDKGKFLDVWKKHADGSWKIIEDIYNMDGGTAE